MTQLRHTKASYHMLYREHLTRILVSVATVGFVLGLVLTVGVTMLTSRRIPTNLDVTYLNPREAVLFWQSPNPAIGYVKYGTSQRQRTTIVEQTSSVPTTIHSVMLEELPLVPIFISFHTDTDPWYQLPFVTELKYQPSQ